MIDHNVHCGSGDPVPYILGRWLSPFRAWFTAPSWEHLLVLVMGAILCPGKRTVTACLRITGRADAGNFSLYHQLLNRARWNAILRTTPSLLALYSLVTLWAGDVLGQNKHPHAAAWYRRTELTFTDALGAVRLVLWSDDIYRHSPSNPEMHKIPPSRLNRMAQALCFAA
ncbi:hypothetical protein G6L32_14425 [Agrobacterium tumefaciens]|nr:hypothetical protein [Agrobacterium tumefaciens]